MKCITDIVSFFHVGNIADKREESETRGSPSSSDGGARCLGQTVPLCRYRGSGELDR